SRRPRGGALSCTDPESWPGGDAAVRQDRKRNCPIASRGSPEFLARDRFVAVWARSLYPYILRAVGALFLPHGWGKRGPRLDHPARHAGPTSGWRDPLGSG